MRIKKTKLEDIFGQSYKSPDFHGLGKGQNLSSYNPFIDVVSFPCLPKIKKGVLKLTLEKHLELQSEMGHHFLSLEMSRLALKRILKEVYRATYEYLVDTDLPPLLVPTFRNASGLRDLTFELNRLYLAFEAIEEVIIVSMQVSEYEYLEDMYDDNFLKEHSPKEVASIVEKDGFYTLKRNFGELYSKAYTDLMEITGRTPVQIYLIGTHGLIMPNAPFLLTGGEGPLTEEDLTPTGKAVREPEGISPKTGMAVGYPERWYHKGLLTNKGRRKIYQLYNKSSHAPYIRFLSKIEFLKKNYMNTKEAKATKDLGSKEQQVALINFMDKAFGDHVRHKTQEVLLFVRDGFLVEPIESRKFDNIVEETFCKAYNQLSVKTANLLLEHKNIMHNRTDLGEQSNLEGMEGFVEQFPEYPFPEKLSEPLPDSVPLSEKYSSLIYFLIDGSAMPQHLVTKYKDLITWESIRQQLFSVSEKDQFNLPWEDKDSKELENFIKSRIEIDTEGIERHNHFLKEREQGRF